MHINFIASTFSFRILYAYNYNSACTVPELSETDNKSPPFFDSPVYLVFSRENWYVMDWDGLVQTNRKILFHSSHGILEISFRNFWSNGKRPRSFISA